MICVYILLGSNIDAERNLRRAVSLLAEHVKVLAVSPVYETEPVGYTEQPCFLNAAVCIRTDYEPERLKKEILSPIERALGRVRTANKNAPRTIDLDIILYGREIIHLEDLRIPDPNLLKYGHVAWPLADLAPDLRHPQTGATLREIADGLNSSSLTCRPDIDLSPLEAS